MPQLHYSVYIVFFTAGYFTVKLIPCKQQFHPLLVVQQVAGIEKNPF